MGAGDAADDIELVTGGRARNQGVEAVLHFQCLGEPRASSCEGGDAPLLAVGRVLRIPGLVSAQEVAQAKMY
jgi:hypothetical protein